MVSGLYRIRAAPRMVLLALLCGLSVAGTPGELPVGAELREARLAGLNGPDLHLSQLRGTPLLINVWASWCGPCQAEMASLERLAWRELPVSVRIIGISTDDEKSAALALILRTHATISHYLDSGREMEDMLGASRLPLTVFVDARGRVLRRVIGARDWDSAESRAMLVSTFSPASTSARRGSRADGGSAGRGR